jgi:hypothetical protein
MKKFFVSFVAIIISLSLAGCTPDSGSGVQNNGSSTTTSAPSTYEYTSTSGRYLLELEIWIKHMVIHCICQSPQPVLQFHREHYDHGELS